MNSAQLALLKRVAPRPVLTLGRRYVMWRMDRWHRKCECLVDQCYERSQAGAHYMTGLIDLRTYQNRLIVIDAKFKRRKRNHYRI